MSRNCINYVFHLMHFTKLTLTCRYLNNCFGSIKLTDSFSLKPNSEINSKHKSQYCSRNIESALLTNSTKLELTCFQSTQSASQWCGRGTRNFNKLGTWDFVAVGGLLASANTYRVRGNPCVREKYNGCGTLHSGWHT